jgi:hypothetical protein
LRSEKTEYNGEAEKANARYEKSRKPAALKTAALHLDLQNAVQENGVPGRATLPFVHRGATCKTFGEGNHARPLCSE